MQALKRRRGEAGFTLVELLLVTSLLGVLFGLILPAVEGVLKSAEGIDGGRDRQLQLLKQNLLRVGDIGAEWQIKTWALVVAAVSSRPTEGVAIAADPPGSIVKTLAEVAEELYDSYVLHEVALAEYKGQAELALRLRLRDTERAAIQDALRELDRLLDAATKGKTALLPYLQSLSDASRD